MRPIRTVGVLIALLLGAPTAVAAVRALAIPVQTASAPLAGGGSVTAAVSYTHRGYYDAPIDLRITRDGQPVSAPAVYRADGCVSRCKVIDDALHAVDLLGDGDPIVLLDLNTGGAHCCSVTDVYRYRPATASYVMAAHNWGDPGYRLERIAGRPVFETNDDRFAYAFTDYAASGLPLQLLAYGPGGFVDVTRRYPERIAADARAWLRAYRQQAPGYPDTVGLIAAWAADEDELGQAGAVDRYLGAQARAGHLRSGSGTPGGLRFVRNLDRFLRRTGYLR